MLCDNMSVTQANKKSVEEIIQEFKALPQFLQEEALDFITYLKLKKNKMKSSKENQDWGQFSLQSALRDIEDDDFPAYQESDFKE